LSRRRFHPRDQEAFARVSGDANPVHVDPVAARRTLFGRPIVHGVHSLLWALDETLARLEPGLQLAELKVLFRKPIGVGEEVVLLAPEPGAERPRIVLEVLGAPAVRIRARFCADGDASGPAVPTDAPQLGACRERSFTEIEAARGALPLHLPDEAAKLFPALFSRLEPAQLAAFLATTRLVGMECPGLHSIYWEFEVDLTNRDSDDPELRWEVTGVDERYSLVSLAATAPGFRARLRTFVRPPAQRQADYESLRGQVAAAAFAGQRALVVGGSRGIGEVTAKLLAAGGASVLLTYKSGRADAESVADEIRSGGGEASTLAFDVLDQGDGPELPDGWHPTHVYYLATPPIMTATQSRFHPTLFDGFARFYVGAFAELVQHLRRVAPELRAVLYPSSVAIDELPAFMGEYSAAKAAGEVLCDFLARVHGLRIDRPRLPRIATDQTATVAHAESEDPVPLLLGLLHDLA
jgi:hypothetical protein